MAEIGYHASHEQFAPAELVALVTEAEQEGFEHVLASDHFHPWSECQGHSGHVWSWLGAAMGSTEQTFGTVNCPAFRYHPAIVAQAGATLASMYPDRFWLCVGSGQLLNEGITGEKWPVKEERNARLREASEVIRELWAGKEVTHHGRVDVEAARVFTRPEEPPDLFGAALSESTARWLGAWAEGLLTLATPDHERDTARIEAFREQAPDAPVFVKIQLSYARDEQRALEGAMDQWRTNCIPGPVTEQLRRPADYDALGEEIDEPQLREHVRISADPEEHLRWIEQDLSLEVDRIFLHNVHPDQRAFIEDFGEHVLPALA